MWWRISLALAAIALAPVALALPGDRDQPVYVEADTADLDENTGIAIYRGSVLIKQGTMEIRGDEVTVTTRDRKFTSLTSIGKPAQFQQQLEEGQSPVLGDALQIHYNAVEATITLQEQAHLRRDEDEFHGNHIRYDTVAGTVKARRADDGSERIKIIIQPETLQGEPAPAQ